MLFDSTKTLLRTIVQSLEVSHQAGWDDQIESGNQCLYEMHQMTRPSYRGYQTTGLNKSPSHVPDRAGLDRAIPHVKAMMSAIRRKDRGTALSCGMAALAALDGPAFSKPVERAAEPVRATPIVSVDISKVVSHHEEAAKNHRPVVADRTSAKPKTSGKRRLTPLKRALRHRSAAAAS